MRTRVNLETSRHVFTVERHTGYNPNKPKWYVVQRLRGSRAEVCAWKLASLRKAEAWARKMAAQQAAIDESRVAR
jgi:hypothetical protein